MKKFFALLLLALLQIQAFFVFAQNSYYYSVAKTVGPQQKKHILYNKNGIQLIPNEHDWISVNYWDWIFVWDNKTAVVYDSLGKPLGIEGIEKTHHVWVKSELLPLKKKGLWGYYNRQGNLQLPHLYEEAALFENGQAAVKLHGRYCYIDINGKELDKTFDQSPDKVFMILGTSVGLTTFSHHPQELVEENGKVGLREKASGKMLIKCMYDGLYSITREAVIAEKNGRYGVVNFKGKIIIPVEQEMIYLLGE